MKTEKVGEGVEMSALPAYADFVSQGVTEAVRFDIDSEDQLVGMGVYKELRGELLAALTEKEELKIKLEARFCQLAGALGRAQLAENRITNAEVQVEELKKQLVAMTEDRNLWQDAHNEDCPNLAQVEELKREVEKLRDEWERADRLISDIAHELGCKEYALPTISVVAMDYKERAEKAESELSACKEVGGCGYWREAEKQRATELKHYEDSPYRHRVLFENDGELSTKNYDDLSDDDLAGLMEYSETCKCQSCYEIGYMLKMRKDLASLRTSVVSGEWIEIKECCEMPTVDTEVMVAFNNSTNPDVIKGIGRLQVSTATWTKDKSKEGTWADPADTYSSYDYLDIKYWAKFPAPPKPIEREG